MTTEELERFKALCDAATPGPWAAGSSAVVGRDAVVVHDAGLEPVDGDFIAESREAMPALIAEVERLQKRVAWLEGQVHQKPGLCVRRVRGLCDVAAHPRVCWLGNPCRFPEDWQLRDMPQREEEGSE